MKEKTKDTIKYVPPKLKVLDLYEVMDNLGPALSCSGYGGAVSGC